MHLMIDHVRCGGKIVNETIEDDDSIHKNLGLKTFLLQRRINQEDDHLYVEQIRVQLNFCQGRPKVTHNHMTNPTKKSTVDKTDTKLINIMIHG